MRPTLRVSQLHKVSSRSCRSSPLAGWQRCSTGQRRPFAPLSLQEIPHYYGRLRPSLWHRYSSSWFLPLVISLASTARFSRSAPKPALSSCRLNTDCRRASKQVSSQLFLELLGGSSFDSSPNPHVR